MAIYSNYTEESKQNETYNNTELPNTDGIIGVIRDKIEEFPDETCKDNLRECLSSFDENNLEKLNNIIDYFTKNKKFCEYTINLNQHNISLFETISTFEVETEKDNAYKIAVRINSEEEVKKAELIFNSSNMKFYFSQDSIVELFDYINEYNYELIPYIDKNLDGSEGGKNALVAALFVNNEKELEKINLVINLYITGTSKLLEDELFICNNYYKRLNEFNIKLFETGSAFKKEDEKTFAFLRAASVTNNEEYEKAEEAFNAFINKSLPEFCNNSAILGLNLISSSNLVNNDSPQNINDYQSYDNIPEGTLVYNEKNKLYIKSDNELRKLNMSKSDFDELFPDNSIFKFSQPMSIGDCYLLSGVNAILMQPKGKEVVLNSLSKEGDDLLVKFSNHDPIRISNYKNTLNNLDKSESVSGSLGWKAIEFAYSKYREDFKTIQSTLNNEIPNENILNSGNSFEIFNCFGFYDVEIKYNPNNHLIANIHESLYDKLENILKSGSENKAICLGSSKLKINNMTNFLKASLKETHAYALIKMEQDKIFISDPHNTAGYLEISKEILNSCFDSISYCNLKTCNFEKKIEISNNPSVVKRDFFNKNNSTRWLMTNINKIQNDDMKMNVLNKIQNLNEKYIIELCDTFIKREVSPYEFLSNNELINYIDQIKGVNITLFKIASNIKDERTRFVAYEFAKNFTAPLFTNKAISFLNIFVKNPDIIMRNYVDPKYLDNISTNTIKLFIMASNMEFNNNNDSSKKRDALYKIASTCEHSSYLRDTLDLFYSINKDPDASLLLNDREFIENIVNKLTPYTDLSILKSINDGINDENKNEYYKEIEMFYVDFNNSESFKLYKQTTQKMNKVLQSYDEENEIIKNSTTPQ